MAHPKFVLSVAISTFILLPVSHPPAVLAAPPAAKPPSPEAVLESTSRAFNDVARKVSPAVVSINAVKIMDSQEAALGFPFGGPFEEGPPGGGESQEPEFGAPPPSMGIGSGVIIRGDGLILTSNHVVENASRVTVTFSGKNEKKEYRARVVGSDKKTDIALIKITDSSVKDLPTINWGNSNKVEVGDWAIAIGNPFGLSHSMTSGIVSATGRGELGVVDTEDFIQTDAAINPGNSGGPLLNMKGEMIGLNAAIFSQTGGFLGIGFSIPSNMVRDITDQLIAHGRVIRGWIGVVAQNLDQELAEYFRVPQQNGALISDVLSKGPADQGSLKAGDVVIQFGNEKVDDATDLKNLVAGTRSGTRVPLKVLRNGHVKSLNLQIREQPQEPEPVALQQAAQVPQEPGPLALGLAVHDVPREFSEILDLPTKDAGALVIGVQPGSSAYEAGILPGDVILRANDQKISNAREFTRFSKELGGQDLAVLHLQRGPEEKLFVPLRSAG